jgi:hypothetical protein
MASPLPQSVSVPKYVLDNPFLPVRGIAHRRIAAHGACKGKGKGKGNGDDDEVRRDLHGSILVDMPAPVPTKGKGYNKDKDKDDKGKDDKVGGNHQAYAVARAMNIDATTFVRGHVTHHTLKSLDRLEFTTRSDIIKYMKFMKASKSKQQLTRQPKCIVCGAGIVAWKLVLCPHCFVDGIKVPAPPPIPHSLSLEESLPSRKVIDEKLACVRYWVDKYMSAKSVALGVKDELVSSNQIESFLVLSQYEVEDTIVKIKTFVESRERIIMANKPPGIRKVYPAGLRCEPPGLPPPPFSFDFSYHDIDKFLHATRACNFTDRFKHDYNETSVDLSGAVSPTYSNFTDRFKHDYKVTDRFKHDYKETSVDLSGAVSPTYSTTL